MAAADETNARVAVKCPPNPRKKFLGSLRMQNHGGFAIFFWHGMCASAWFSLLRRNRFRTTANCWPQPITVTLMSLINSALYRLSEAVYARKLEGFELDQPPVFIIGHWRSGTTYLHDLLACDPEFGYPTTYECFAPNHFLLSERAARFWFDFVLPSRRPPDNVTTGFNRPQEDEFALCNLGLHSPLLTMALPRQGPVDMDYLDLANLTEAERRAWLDGFLWFIRRVAFRQGKRLILKSPTHTARLRALIKLFPEARFIYIARNPLSVFPSTIHLWKSMNSTQGLENPPNDDPWLQDFVLDTFMHMFQRYEEDRRLVPAGNIAEVTYEDLVASPKGVLRGLYDRLGLGDFGRAEAEVDAYLARTKDYKTNTYELSEAAADLIRERWAPYIRRFGYDKRSEQAAA